jgi:hypothetical protein
MRDLFAVGVATSPVAALLTIALHGRTTLSGLSLQWATTFAVLALTTVAWAVLARAWNRHGNLHPASIATAISGLWRGLVPAAIVAAAATTATYISDDLFHALAHEPRLAGTLLPATILLAGTAPWWVDRRAHLDRAAEDRARDLATVVSLLATGVATSGAWHVVATDDLLRYWAIADALRANAPYFVTDGTPGDGKFYLVDLPAYPLLASFAFEAMGHTYAALRMPAIISSVFFPLTIWWAIRAIGAGRVWSVTLAVAIATLPHSRTYVLGAAQPDGLLAVLLATFLALVASSRDAIRGDGPFTFRRVVAIGLISTAAILTRPEGALFIGVIATGTIMSARPTRWSSQTKRNLAAGATLASAPVAIFSATIARDLGIIWPSGWASIASSSFILPNLRIVTGSNVPWYAESVGLPRSIGIPIAVAILLATFVGMARLVRQRPELATTPLAAGLSVVVILASPTYLTGDLFSPATFYRHLAASLPCVAVALATLGPLAGRAATRGEVAAIVIAVAVTLGNLVVLASATERLRRGQLTIYPQESVVTVSKLWKSDPPLPKLPITVRESGGSTFSSRFDYLGYRAELWSYVHAYQQHLDDEPRGWALATGTFALGAMVAASGIRGIRP